MIPLRSCIICKSKKPKSELLRVACILQNNMYTFELDSNQGRGIYLCKDYNCIQKWIHSVDKQKNKFKYKINQQSMLKILNDLKLKWGENLGKNKSI